MDEAEDITMRVLVAEDEEILAELVATGLRRAGFAVDTVYSGDAAQAYLGLHDYDAVVLDRDLPRVHGDDVARELVASGSRTRILMLTAAGSMEDRVSASTWAPTTTWASRSSSPSWSRGYARCVGAASGGSRTASGRTWTWPGWWRRRRAGTRG